MTNEQAIEVINGHIKDSCIAYGTFTGQALHMAIEALKAQLSQEGTTTDTISRQAAIDEIDEWIKAFLENGHKESAADACLIQDGIIQLPSAQPDRIRGRWAPHREKGREYIGATLVYITYDYWSCDTCGYRVEDGQPLYNFCPHCGADMRGVQDELSEREIEQCCDNCKWYRSMDDYCVSYSCNIDGREKHSCFEEK